MPLDRKSALILQQTANEHDDYWMGQALLAAKEAQALGEVPVGAVIVKDNLLLATGYNRTIIDHDPSAHAEIVALRAAGQHIENYRLPGATLYVTLEPCIMCVGAILHARLARVVFGAFDPKTGAAGSVLNIFESHQLNHQTSLTSGVQADACGQCLRAFFQLRRKQQKQQKLTAHANEEIK